MGFNGRWMNAWQWELHFFHSDPTSEMVSCAIVLRRRGILLLNPVFCSCI